MHGLTETQIKRMNSPEHKSCETVEHVMHRYTDGYEEWCEATNDIQDIECLAIAVNDMQLLIEALKAK